MTKAKATQRALLLSLLSMLLCFSMLVGSTFAWFTDTVSSGVNTIMAGNLDIALQYSSDMETWADVTGKTDIFDSEKWEPGRAEVVYFKVTNAGSLAFKYKFGTQINNNTIGKTADDQDIDLTKYIKFGLIENVTAAYTSREDAVAALNGKETNLGTYSSTVLEMEADAADEYVAMVVYMPTTVGNEANHGTGKTVPEIKFGISVTATQLESESDSFGNDYDANAKLPESVTGEIPEPETGEGEEEATTPAIELTGDAISATIPAGATLTAEGSTDALPAGTKLILNADQGTLPNGFTVVAGGKTDTYEITLTTEDGKKVTSDKPIAVTLNIGANREGAVAIYHNTDADALTSTYNKTEGKISFETNGFSPFTVVERPYTLDELKGEAAANLTGKISVNR